MCPLQRSRKTSQSARGSFLAGQKRGGCKPITYVDIPPQPSGLEAVLAKSGEHILGRVLGPVRWEERSKAKNKHRPQRTVLCGDLSHLRMPALSMGVSFCLVSILNKQSVSLCTSPHVLLCVSQVSKLCSCFHRLCLLETFFHEY